jgi:hypothetical protein
MGPVQLQLRSVQSSRHTFSVTKTQVPVPFAVSEAT